MKPHHQLTGDIRKLLAVTPQDRGPFWSVLSCHSEVPSSQKPVFPSHLMHPCDPLTPGFYCVLIFLPLLCHFFRGSFLPLAVPSPPV